MIKPEFTPEQTVNLRNLLNVAVQAGGMQAAELAVPLDAILRSAAEIWQAGEQDRMVLERAAILSPSPVSVADDRPAE